MFKILLFVFGLIPQGLFYRLSELYISYYRRKYLFDFTIEGHAGNEFTSIQNRFVEFKKEIYETYIANSNKKTLDITSMNFDELSDTGYFIKKAESFLFINEFNQYEVNDYFFKYCRNKDSFGKNSDYISPAEYVEYFINETVIYKLECELNKFILTLKTESEK